MRDITKVFPGVKALDRVNIEVAEGEIHAVCGENGAGKSTLMNVLSGIYPFGTYEGDIIFQTSCSLSDDDTPDTIAAKVHKLEYEFYPKVIGQLLN